MGFVKAEWMSTELTGGTLPAGDVFPPSSRQDLIPTLPGVAPGAPPPAPPYAPSYSSRPMAETQAYTPPSSSRKEQTTATEADEPRTEWCVDLGNVLSTMDTFELWAAIDRGDVVASMRVWREGMECWTPIGQVLDLSLALQTPSTSRTPGPVALPEAPNLPHARTVPHASVALAFSAPPAARPSLLQPAAQLEVRAPIDTLISGPRPSAWGRLSQRVLPRPKLQHARAQLWVAAGSAVAGLAVLTAVARVELTSAPAAPPGVPVAAAAAVIQAAALPLEMPAEQNAEVPTVEVPAAGAPHGAPVVAELGAADPAVPVRAPLPEQVHVPGVLRNAPGASTAVSAPGAAPRTSRDIHRDDYGQRRRGRSGRRAYGW